MKPRTLPAFHYGMQGIPIVNALFAVRFVMALEPSHEGGAQVVDARRAPLGLGLPPVGVLFRTGGLRPCVHLPPLASIASNTAVASKGTVSLYAAASRVTTTSRSS